MLLYLGLLKVALHVLFIFDSSALNDPCYFLYSAHAISLTIAGVVLLIAIVGTISSTLKKISRLFTSAIR